MSLPVVPRAYLLALAPASLLLLGSVILSWRRRRARQQCGSDAKRRAQQDEGTGAESWTDDSDTTIVAWFDRMRQLEIDRRVERHEHVVAAAAATAAAVPIAAPVSASASASVLPIQPASVVVDVASVTSSPSTQVHRTPSLSASSSPSLLYRPASSLDVASMSTLWFYSYLHAASRLHSASKYATLDDATADVRACVDRGAGDETIKSLVAYDASWACVVASAIVDEVDINTSGVVVLASLVVSAYSAQLGLGHLLMTSLLSSSLHRDAKSIRVIADRANLPLLMTLSRAGFTVREVVTLWGGSIHPRVVADTVAAYEKNGWTLHTWATQADVREVDELWTAGTGTSRIGVLTRMAASASACVADRRWCVRDRRRRIIAFTTGFGHQGACGATSVEAMQYLLCASIVDHCDTLSSSSAATIASSSSPCVPGPVPAPLRPSFRTCSRLHSSLTRWLLNAGMRVVETANVATIGAWKHIDYNKFVYGPAVELM